MAAKFWITFCKCCKVTSQIPTTDKISKKVTKSALAKNGSPRNSQSSDEMYLKDVPMSIEDPYALELNQKVQVLQHQMTTVMDQLSKIQRYIEGRLHSPEEQLREHRIQSKDGVETKQQKFKEIMLFEELIRELQKQHSGCNNESRLRSPSLLESRAQNRELQQELRKIKDENKLMQETNEELIAHFLGSSLQEDSTLVNQGTEISLADEFETLTKDEMIREQKEVIAKLKAYIDKILLNILENHPQLLEVKKRL